MVTRGTIILDKSTLQESVGLREGNQCYRHVVKFPERFPEPPEVDLTVAGMEPFGHGGWLVDVVRTDCKGFTVEIRSGPGLGILGLRLRWRAEDERSPFRLLTTKEARLAMTASEGEA